MSKFTSITAAVLAANERLAEYLRQADIKQAKKGGAFVGNYDVAPDEFRRYGIVLPKGGMIIPDISPEELREIIMAEYNVAKESDEERRENDRKILVAATEKLLGQNGLSDISVVVKNDRDYHNIGSTAVVEVVLVRGGDDELLSLRSEKEPNRSFSESNKEWKDWHVSEISSDVVNSFVEEEVRLVEPRKLFADRISRLVEMSHAVGQQELGEDGWDRPRVELFLFDDYSKTNDWGFFGRRCESVLSTHRIMYRKELYELTEEDVSRLEREVSKRTKKATARQGKLKKLFFEHLGVFSYEARTYEPSEVRHSLVDGRVKDDSWTERHYFLGKEEVTREEYEWLNTFLNEIKVPEGHVRVANDTHDLLRVPEVPGRNDVLVVVGKTGSRRGVWSYGEWFRGHPSECQISFWHKGTARKLKSVALNGTTLESTYINLDKWKKSKEIAKWALEEAGVHEKDDSSFRYEEFYKFVDAVVQYYVDHGLVSSE